MNNCALRVFSIITFLSISCNTFANKHLLEKFPGTTCDKAAILLIAGAIGSSIKGFEGNDPKYIALSIASSCAAFGICVFDLRCSSKKITEQSQNQ